MNYVYHLALQTDWDKACQEGIYKVGSLNRSFDEDGFIHLAYADQVNVIADLIYAGRNDLVLLRIDTDKLQAEIKQERAEYPAELFPHLYGPLNLDAVTKVEPYNALLNGHFPRVEA